MGAKSGKKTASSKQPTRRQAIAKDAADLPEEIQASKTSHNTTTTLAVDAEEFDWDATSGVNDGWKLAGSGFQELVVELKGKKLSKSLMAKIEEIQQNMQKGAEEDSNALEKSSPIREDGAGEVEVKSKKHDKVVRNRADVAANQAAALGLEGHDADAAVSDAVKLAHNAELKKLKDQQAAQEAEAKERNTQIKKLQEAAQEQDRLADIARKSAEEKTKTALAEERATRKRCKDLTEAIKNKVAAENRSIGKEMAELETLDARPVVAYTQDDAPAKATVVNPLDTSKLTDEQKEQRREKANKSRNETLVKKKVLANWQSWESAALSRKKELKTELKTKTYKIRKLESEVRDKAFRIDALKEFGKKHGPKNALGAYMKPLIEDYNASKKDAATEEEEDDNDSGLDDDEQRVTPVVGFAEMVANEKLSKLKSKLERQTKKRKKQENQTNDESSDEEVLRAPDPDNAKIAKLQSPSSGKKNMAFKTPKKAKVSKTNA